MGADHAARSTAGRREPTARRLSALSGGSFEPLLRELLERVGNVTTEQERLRALLAAVISLDADGDLNGVLARMVAVAARLTDANFAALAVLGANHRLTDFVTYGLADQGGAKLDSLPDGSFVLSLLAAYPQPVRLEQITDHPRFESLPANPPSAGPFLGVPLRFRDHLSGYLYLTGKRAGDSFSEQDKQLVAGVSVVAKVAIENARLHALTNRRRRWLYATGELSQSLLSPIDRAESLRLIVQRALEVSGCDLAAVLLRVQHDFVIEVAHGFGAAQLSGLRLPRLRGVVSQAIDSGRPILVGDFASDSRMIRSTGPAGEVLRDIGQMIFVPFRAGGRAGGALAVGWRHQTETGFSEDDVELVQNFAVHAALALEHARFQEDRQLLALLEDRDRIARDLHDQVIQRLFAIGMDLQGTSRLAPRPEVQQRILGAVDDLDATIDEIRGTIFDLRRAPGSTDLRGEIRDIVAAAVPTLGFTPQVAIRGPARHLVDDDLRPHLLAAIREGLANVARHAQASRVKVSLTVGTAEIELQVEDDGRGIGGSTRRSGLANLAARAARLGGTCEVGPGSSSGTLLVWRVPRRERLRDRATPTDRPAARD